jgi:hypothetical protein
MLKLCNISLIVSDTSVCPARARCNPSRYAVPLSFLGFDLYLANTTLGQFKEARLRHEAEEDAKEKALKKAADDARLSKWMWNKIAWWDSGDN